ncbi:MAG: protein kinase [Candidatus Eisenbacteria bacterium]
MGSIPIRAAAEDGRTYDQGRASETAALTEREKQLLGKYELLSELGRGGMGAVYRAHDPIIGRDVAIKVILDVALSAPGTRERFQREARSAGRLSHENIVTLHDFDEWDGKPYLVMELLAGTDLRQAILDDSLPLRNVSTSRCRSRRGSRSRIRSR